MQTFNVQETAERLKVSESTVYNEVRRGRLQASRVGKRLIFTEQHINQYIAKGETYMSSNGERTLVVPPASQMPSAADLESMMKLAEIYAGSDLVPKEFQGKKGNVFIALEFAYRINMNPFAVMQSLYIVSGRPSWSGQMAIALVNSSGLFDKPLQFVFSGTGDDYGCQAVTTKGGIPVEGPKVDWKMVKAEGWNRDKGSMKSKWTTLPGLMFRYRAGAYFARTVCPQVLLGLQTVEEVEELDHLGGEVYGRGDTLPPAIDHDGTEPPPPAAEETANWETLSAGMDRVEGFVKFTADAFQTTPEHVKAQAIKKWDDFTTAYGKWVAQNAGADKPTSPEAAEGTISGEPEESIAPEPKLPEMGGETQAPAGFRAATKAQIQMIQKVATDLGMTEAMVCKEKDVSLYTELSQDAAGELLTWLKNLK